MHLDLSDHLAIFHLSVVMVSKVKHTNDLITKRITNESIITKFIKQKLANNSWNTLYEIKDAELAYQKNFRRNKFCF